MAHDFHMPGQWLMLSGGDPNSFCIKHFTELLADWVQLSGSPRRGFGWGGRSALMCGEMALSLAGGPSCRYVLWPRSALLLLRT